MSNPEVTISLSAPANNERDANRQNPFSLAGMGVGTSVLLADGHKSPHGFLIR